MTQVISAVKKETILLVGGKTLPRLRHHSCSTSCRSGKGLPTSCNTGKEMMC